MDNQGLSGIVESILSLNSTDTKGLRSKLRTLGEAASHEERASSTVKEFLDRLSGLDDVSQMHNLVTAICVILEHSKSKRDQKKTINYLLKVVGDSGKAPGIRRLIAHSLAYVEPGFPDANREHFSEKMADLYCDLDVQAIKDTYESYKFRENIIHRVCPKSETVTKLKRITKKLRIVSVHSLKGGVGKTLLSHVVARQLSKEGRKACVIDCDFFGPSAQFIVDLPVLAKIAEKGDKDGLLVSPPFPELSMQLNGPVPKSKLEELIYEAPERDCGSVIPLTHNTVQLPGLAWAFKDDYRFNQILDNLVDVFALLHDQGYKYVIMDNHPGLYSHQGQMIEFLSVYGEASLIVVSGPNSYDILVSAYEVVWLANRARRDRAFTMWVGNGFHAQGPEDPIEVLNLYSDQGGQVGVQGGERLFYDCLAVGRFLLADEDYSHDHVLRSYARGRLLACAMREDSRIRNDVTPAVTGKPLLDYIADLGPCPSSGSAYSWYERVRQGPVEAILAKLGS